MGCFQRLGSLISAAFNLGVTGALLYVLYITFRISSVHGLWMLFAVAFPSMVPAVYFLLAYWPRRISVEPGRVVVEGLFRRRVMEGFRVVEAFSQDSFRDVVYAKLVGSGLTPWHLFGLFSTRHGRAWLYSTPYCGGQWILLEAGGRRYLVCCEERDREICRSLGAPPPAKAPTCTATAALSMAATVAMLAALFGVLAYVSRLL